VRYTTPVVMFVVLILGLAAPIANATNITLVGDSMTGLLGSSYSPATPLLTLNASNGVLSSVVYSEAFTDGQGLYLYLYQLWNTGTPVINSSVEMFTIGPVAGTVTPGDLGYLTEEYPTGFLGDPQQLAESVASVKSLLGGLDVSFYYTSRADMEIEPGEHSCIMYLLSRQQPGMILGSVIDHQTSTGKVVGPVPEPGTLALLSMAGLMASTAGWFAASRRNSGRSS
jgi:hypothetical protein